MTLVSFSEAITNHKSIKQEELNLFNIKLPQANIKRDLGDYKLWLLKIKRQQT